MQITIKTKKEMLEDPKVIEDENTLQKGSTETFIVNSIMEDDLCGKTFKVFQSSGSEHWPYSVKSPYGIDWIIPGFAVKEVVK